MNLLFLCIILPLIVSNIVHIVLVKKNMFPYLAIPISKPLFGQNKTWRGFAIVPLLNALILSSISCFLPNLTIERAFVTGFLMGVAYMLFELPNSFLKRRLGIASGEKAEKHSTIFMLLDKTDSSFGVSILCYFLLHLSFMQTVALFLISIATHISFSWLLVIVKIKKRF